MTAPAPQSIAATPADFYFESFAPGQRFRHSRGLTVGEFENSLMSRLVMNTAQSHWNEHQSRQGPLASGRVVFGLITASIVFGLAGHEIGDHALAELNCHDLRFLTPVRHGDTLFALTEVRGVQSVDAAARLGVVEFQHWGLNQRDELVFAGQRTLEIERRPGPDEGETTR